MYICIYMYICRGLTACAADPGHAMQCHACKGRGNVMQYNTKRCSYAGSPRWVKDAECKCNAHAKQCNNITNNAPQGGPKLVRQCPHWHQMAPSWPQHGARTTQFEFTAA